MSSYGWLINNWSPSLTEQNIEIATSGGLMIGLSGEDGDTKYTSVALNSIFGVESFTFKQVSSLNGEDFFWVDFSPSMEGGDPVLRTANAKENGYIDVDFCLVTESAPNTSSKYVYLHHETEIKDTTDPYNAPDCDLPSTIRIAITFKGADVPVRIFGMKREGFGELLGTEPGLRSNDEVDVRTKAVKPGSDGKPIDVEAKPLQVDIEDYQTVYKFSDFNGGRFDETAEDNKTAIDEDKILYTMAASEIRWVNVKIWLEGGSDGCTSALSGLKFGLVLKFGSSNVPPKPAG